MKLDIVIIAYNHSRFIEQAMDTLCVQSVPTDCVVRVLVADDCSKDDTLSKILAYQTKVEARGWSMEVLQAEHNLGISRNYQRSFAACDGDYVAILEGDDYWLMDGHLMQHIEFLEQHPECSMSMNRITYQWGINPELKPATWYADGRPYEMTSLQKQIEWGNQLGNLSACMFRTKYVKKIPAKAFNVYLDDFLIGIYMAEQGLIGLMNDSTSVYRGNENSLWAGKSHVRQFYEGLRHCRIYDHLTDGRYHELWKAHYINQWKNERMYVLHFLKQKVLHLLRK